MNDAFIAGPYIYPPTLLQLFDILRVDPLKWIFFLYGGLICFCVFWQRATQHQAWWLLLAVFSWDVLVSFAGGNIEIILLTMTLLGALRLWRGQILASTIFIAFVVLIKPFYALFFATFGLLYLFTQPDWREALRRLTLSASGAIGLVGLAVVLWPSWLRPLAFDYLLNGLSHTWYVLPIAEQSPMSMWNRSFMQAVASLGISAIIAQLLTLLMWGIVTAITIRQVHQKFVGFPILFAFSFLLLYWFRPVGWGLIFLDLVVLTAVVSSHLLIYAFKWSY